MTKNMKLKLKKSLAKIILNEEPEEFEYKDGSVTLFGKLVKKIFKKDKITKEDVEGPTLKLLKGTCKNSIQLEYNMDQCHLALIDKIDWSDRFHNDLNKPLPLTGPPGRKIIPVSYFFNHDLEYLNYGTKESMYAFLVTKIKAARYEDKGIEERFQLYGARVFKRTTKMLNWESTTGINIVIGSTKAISIISLYRSLTHSLTSECSKHQVNMKFLGTHIKSQHQY
ncbi:hypothetical protein Tco_0853836 [Tanacetum coccineum]